MGGNLIAAWLGRSAGLHPQLAQLYAEKYHLNDPIWVQYYYYIIALLQGNLGFSPSRGFLPVVTVIGQTLPLTLQLVVVAFIITIAVGMGLGMVSARYSHTSIDGGIRTFYLAAYASPPFFVGLMFLICFTYVFKILPSGGAYDPNILAPSTVTGFPILDGLIAGDWAYSWSYVIHMILPSVVLALTTFGVLTRLLRSSLLEVMQTNYIRTARAKGVDENIVFYKHALRNAMIPVVSLSSMILTWLITSTIFVENVFAYPGMGQYLVSAVAGQDYPGILGTTLVYAVVIVVGNLVADLLYAVVDPQIRLE
jgi:peptide/nickel transport system permease protein